jgi:aryl-alcohol dehydrogenase-like predicted oxidoreductase
VTGSAQVGLGDVTVGRLGFGTMSLTGPGAWGAPQDPDEARRVLRRAVELGIDFFDTADSYGPAAAETLVAEALHPYDGLVVATKAGLTRQGPGRWSRNARPEYLRDACHASLERLRVDRIDLFQLHAVDPAVPIEESLGALSVLRAEGKIRHVGVCNVDADQLGRALAVGPIVSVQNRFSLADRSSRDVLELCERNGLAFIPWAPLAKGTLTRANDALDEIAHAHDATSGQVALAWILATSPTTLPIPGTSSVAHLEENAGASRLRLSADDLAALARATFDMPSRRRSSRRALHRLTRLVRR